MRIVHLDPTSGVTGAAMVGALLDLGASLEAVQRAVESLGVGNVRITMGRVRREGLDATSIRVRAPEQTPSVATWARVRNVLEYAALEDDLRRHAAACLTRLARTEAQAQAVDLSAVEFHEAAALDALAVVVGTCAALASLGPSRLTCGPVAAARSDAVGAAMIAELAELVTERPAMAIEREGAGAVAAGTTHGGVLRASLGTAADGGSSDA